MIRKEEKQENNKIKKKYKWRTGKIAKIGKLKNRIIK